MLPTRIASSFKAAGVKGLSRLGIPANTIHWDDVVLTLAQRLRRWSNIKTTSSQCIVLARISGDQPGCQGDGCGMLIRNRWMDPRDGIRRGCKTGSLPGATERGATEASSNLSRLRCQADVGSMLGKRLKSCHNNGKISLHSRLLSQYWCTV